MASAISGFINQIQNAVYGEKVRSAIVGALEACYSDVENPDLQSAAFQTAIENAYEDGILDITTVTSFNDMTNQNIIYRYNGTAAGKQKGLYYYSALSNSWVLIGSEIQKVSLASQMTDVNDIYRYIGTETGMKQNSLYCHNGTSWVPIGNDIETDTTLSEPGQPADAEATGDAIAELQQAIDQKEGLSQRAITALLACFQNVAWANAQGQQYYTALENALTPQTPEVPDGYTQYDYIKSTKTANQTLDSRNKLVLDTLDNALSLNVEVEFGYETGVTQYTNVFFGGQLTNSNSADVFEFSTNGAGLSMFACGVSTNYQQNIQSIAKKKNIAKYFGAQSSPSSYQANDESPYSITWASGVTSLQIQPQICGYHRHSDSKATLVPYVLCGKVTIKSLSDALLHKYIPCVRNTDNVIGVYDTVTDTFFTTAQPAYATIGNSSCYYAVGNWEA